MGDVHHSYGDSKLEPHFSVPLYQSLNHISRGCVTSGGLGSLTQPYLSSTTVKDRQNFSDSTAFITDHYTFGAWNNYLDLEAWQLSGVPGVGKVDLHEIWGQGSLVISFDFVPISVDSAVECAGNFVGQCSCAGTPFLRLELVHKTLARWHEVKRLFNRLLRRRGQMWKRQLTLQNLQPVAIECILLAIKK